MMIAGLGIDLAELGRIKQVYDKYGSHFLRKLLTPAELEYLPRNAVPWLAGRFAAKEACLKALGTGLDWGITFQDIQVTRGSNGRPSIIMRNRAESYAKLLGITRTMLSITHEKIAACAIVILEK